MKYFEVSHPYYALLKAENKEVARVEYNAAVSGLDDINEIQEVAKEYALLRFSLASEPNKDLVYFNNPEISVLVIDEDLM